MKKTTTRLTALALALVLLLTACGSDASAATMRLRKTEGRVGVSDGEGKAVELTDNLGLYSGYGVDTSTESYAWIDLDSVKLAKLDADSRMEITKEGKKLEINVKSGNLFFHVTEPLDEDESMEIRTSTMAVGIRGTCGWVTQNSVALLEGTVTVTAGGQSVTISAGEQAVLTPGGTLETQPLAGEQIPDFIREEIEDDQDLMKAVSGSGDSGTEQPDAGIAAPSAPVFVPWAEAGLTDHEMDWQDAALAAKMAELTGITDREILLSDVWELTTLSFGHDPLDISDISALGELTNLTSLQLSNTNVSDIGPLSSLTNLTYLSLAGSTIAAGSGISDIGPLSGLTNLTQLYLPLNSISDLGPLAGLTNLTSLGIQGNYISDITPLAGLTNLTYLDLSQNSISDISPLSGLTRLNSLYIADNSISGISPLAGLTNLTQLSLTRNSVSDLHDLSGLTGLTSLRLDGNEVSDLGPLANLTNLEYLYLSDNYISDFSPVEFVPHLSGASADYQRQGNN